VEEIIVLLPTPDTKKVDYIGAAWNIDERKCPAVEIDTAVDIGILARGVHILNAIRVHKTMKVTEHSLELALLVNLYCGMTDCMGRPAAGCRRDRIHVFRIPHLGDELPTESKKVNIKPVSMAVCGVCIPEIKKKFGTVIPRACPHYRKASHRSEGAFERFRLCGCTANLVDINCGSPAKKVIE
jgi:hypothetical protein